jgi:ubiquinone/menaquinone biosynthesis C-methylase UbiE
VDGPARDGSGNGAARQGRKFAGAAPDYDRGRPGWPRAVLDLAATAFDLPAGATVVDVGAGTGKLTRLLAERFTVVAVEPLAAMRALLAAHLPGVRVSDGTAEQLPLPDGVAQAVFVAEGFHWFDGARALAEAARVLRPGGGIVLLWNVPAGSLEPPLPAPARKMVEEAISAGGQPGRPLVARGQWRRAFPGSPFEQPHHERVTHEFVRDRAGLIANLLSISSIAGQAPAVRERLRERLTALLPDRRFRQVLRAEMYWARLAEVRWCDRCGGALADGSHEECAAARSLEPPRYCPRCRRRMTVQVLPAGWTATCAEHGETRPYGET